METVWLQTFFKTSFLLLHRRKVWNDMREDYSYLDGLRSFFCLFRMALKAFNFSRKQRNKSVTSVATCYPFWSVFAVLNWSICLDCNPSRQLPAYQTQQNQNQQTRPDQKTSEDLQTSLCSFFHQGGITFVFPFLFLNHKTISIFLQKLHAGIIWFKVVFQPG